MINSEFQVFLDELYHVAPWQRPRIEAFFSNCDKDFFARANSTMLAFNTVLQHYNFTISDVVKAYVDMCSEMLRENIKFMRNDRYSASSFKEVMENTYSKPQKMIPYMLGLAISQFLWENHYKIFDFFVSFLQNYPLTKNYLEIGVGHGLFFMQAIMNLSKETQFLGVDISSTSLELTKIFSSLAISDQNKKISFEIKDVMTFEKEHGQFDSIVMGEVLEHVEDPLSLLNKIYSLLTKTGSAFITTCSCCPAIDHIFLYRNPQEIRDMINSVGFTIKHELILPVAELNKSMKNPLNFSCNYAAILSK